MVWTGTDWVDNDVVWDVQQAKDNQAYWDNQRKLFHKGLEKHFGKTPT